MKVIEGKESNTYVDNKITKSSKEDSFSDSINFNIQLLYS